MMYQTNRRLVVLIVACVVMTAVNANGQVAVTKSRLISDLLMLEEAREVSSLDAAELRTSLRADGTWPDIDYTDRSRATWAPRHHLERMLKMAQAYRDPASPHHDSASMLQASVRAYDRWISSTPASDNWWWNDIGGPRRLGRVMILLDGQLSSGQRTAGTTILQRGDLGQTGQNLLWRADITVMRAVINNDPATLSAAYRAVDSLLVIAPGTQEGIKIDQSFHQHGSQLYNGGYGLRFPRDASRLASLARSTHDALGAEKTDTLQQYLLDGQRWTMHGRLMDYSVLGRELTRKEATDQGAAFTSEALRYTLTLDSSRKSELEQFKTSIEENDTQSLVGNRHFFRSDYMVHHRPGSMTSVRMRSTRTLGAETINGENPFGYYLADGATFFYREGDEYRDIFPVWNWRQVPGTTVEQRPNPPVRSAGVETEPGLSSFVGGASDGTNGVAAMNYNQAGVTGRKSWFMIGDRVVALGAALTAPNAANPVFTTLNQELLSGAITVGEHDGSRSVSGATTSNNIDWIHHDGVGYVMLNASRLTVRGVTQTGNWRQINAQYDETAVSHDVFAATIDHGTRPSNASYAYMVAHGLTAAQTAQLKADQPVSILRNDADLQAVYDRLTGVIGAAFYSPGTLTISEDKRLSSDQPLLLLLSAEQAGYRLTLANPLNESMLATIRMNSHFTGDGVTWDVTNGQSIIRLQLPGGEMAGSSVSVLLTPIPEPTSLLGVLAGATFVLRRHSH